MKLDELGVKYDTDKSSTGHNYLSTYESWLQGLQVKELLEIGIFKGGSLRMWAEYYPDAKIWGIDNDKGWLINEGNIHSELINQGDEGELKVFWELNQLDPDLVIDDGSHKWVDQMVSFFTIFPKLKSGAVYILEDLHSSKHLDYNNGPIAPLWLFRNVEVFRMIKDIKWFDNPKGNQGLGSISLYIKR